MLNSFFGRSSITALIVALTLLTGLNLGCSSPNAPAGTLNLIAVSPTGGSTDNVTEVNITGSGFLAGATVRIGGAATDVRVMSNSLIRALTPMHSAGTVDVIVTNPGGTSASIVNGFTYFDFSLSSVSPQRGVVGDLLRIQGQGFSTTALVTVGDVNALVIQRTVSQLTAVAPTLPIGAVDVTVTNANGQRRSLPQGFTYDAVSVSASPTTVKATGPLSLAWATPGPRPGSDWIGLYLVGALNDDSYVWWQYTGGTPQATINISAPGQPGAYEFRYFPADGYVDAARSGVITVLPPGDATLRAAGSAGLQVRRSAGSQVRRSGEPRAPSASRSRHRPVEDDLRQRHRGGHDPNEQKLLRIARRIQEPV